MASFIESVVERDNKRAGTLNEQDGIECNKCNNKGYLFYVGESGGIEVKDCDCMAKRKSIMYIKESGLGKLLDHRIGNYEATNDWQKYVKDIAMEYVKNNKTEWFTFLGHSGIGKTMICSAIANNFVRNLCMETKYIVWNDFADKIRDFDNQDFTLIKNCKVLYIDDLFKGKMTEWQRELAFKLINYRYNNNLTTIISSEMALDDLREVDEAIASRIYQASGKYFIEVRNGENYRFK